MKKCLASFALLCITTMLVVACGASSAPSIPTPTPISGHPCPSIRCIPVHLGLTSFAQSSVTISKGDSLTLIDDTATVHNINNGSWTNGVAKPMQEAGAPTVSNLQFSTAGQSQVIGPFNTAGTFHLYCRIHTGMNLTIIVQ